jgi:hypothetical protein
MNYWRYGCEKSILNTQEDINNKIRKFQYIYEKMKRTSDTKQGKLRISNSINHGTAMPGV